MLINFVCMQADLVHVNKAAQGRRKVVTLQQLMEKHAYAYYVCVGKKFPLEQANQALKAAEEPGRSSHGKYFLEG